MAFVSSLLENANIVWNAHTSKDVIAIETIQLRAIKTYSTLMHKLNKMAYQDQLKKAN